jgi:S-formylglutathione hydrolase FrmB
MRLEAIGPPGRCRGGVVMIYWFRPPRVNPSCHPYAREGQAVVCPLLRGRSPTRSVAPKQPRASDGMRLEHQLQWSPHVLSNSDDATSTVSFGQAIASSNGFAVATDPTNPLTRG